MILLPVIVMQRDKKDAAMDVDMDNSTVAYEQQCKSKPVEAATACEQSWWNYKPKTIRRVGKQWMCGRVANSGAHQLEISASTGSRSRTSFGIYSMCDD